MAHITYKDGIPTLNDPWSVEDIQLCAQDRQESIELTDDQVDAVMWRLVKSHDANIGINWEVIGIAIDSVLEDTVEHKIQLGESK